MSGEKILITGASSGIGHALALRLAKPGATLGLVARRRERLEGLARELESRSIKALVYEADVAERAAMAQVGQDFLVRAGGVTLVIANAGIGKSDRPAEGDPTHATRIISVNVQGLLHTLFPLIPAMVAQKSGHLVAVGSVAGFRGLPRRAAYAASKAAVKTLMDGFRLDLRRYGIHVTTICPGFVESEMNPEKVPGKPFYMRTEKAALLIAGAIARRKKTYVFPWQWRVLLPFIVRAPDWAFPDEP